MMLILVLYIFREKSVKQQKRDRMKQKKEKENNVCERSDLLSIVYSLLYINWTYIPYCTFNLLEIQFGHCLVYILCFLCIFSI